MSWYEYWLQAYEFRDQEYIDIDIICPSGTRRKTT